MPEILGLKSGISDIDCPAGVVGNIIARKAGEEISHVYSEGGIIEEPRV